MINIKIGSEKIEKLILKTANERAAGLGTPILDFKIKRPNQVQEVRENAIQRMNGERFRIADKFRSEGQGAASGMNGEKLRDLKYLPSNAFELQE